MKFYVATVVKGNSWSATGEVLLEPVRQTGVPAIGKEPDWCCSTLRKHLQAKGASERLLFCSGTGGEPQIITPRIPYAASSSPFQFCPFCGDKFEFSRNLRLVVKETNPRTIYENRWEEQP